MEKDKIKVDVYYGKESLEKIVDELIDERIDKLSRRLKKTSSLLEGEDIDE
ncbi:hypothetical protein [Hathewaya limosa]|uniref:tRNA G10 N-methylase Trm11 n=1 Tax=Hathewaya limosa TaxID=1536 RepID=A0ABU0JMR4_HATLI|nr:hypothetical protein [Hathewaya limosa]MDQ0478350.1 tRNA G10 N-methylase Trm11 [Hathewaya limosa]